MKKIIIAGIVSIALFSGCGLGKSPSADSTAKPGNVTVQEAAQTEAVQSEVAQTEAVQTEKAQTEVEESFDTENINEYSDTESAEYVDESVLETDNNPDNMEINTTESEEISDEVEIDDSNQDNGRTEYSMKEISESLDEICMQIKQENASIGIAVIDDSFDGSWGDVQDVIYESGYAEKYPFMTSISMESYISTEGSGLICVIPVDTSTTVSVNHIDEKKEPDKLLYRHERALPLLIKCDTGTEIPRILINSVSEDSEASLYIMMNRGKLVMPNGGGVCDLTLYQDTEQKKN